MLDRIDAQRQNEYDNGISACGQPDAGEQAAHPWMPRRKSGKEDRCLDQDAKEIAEGEKSP